MDHERLLRSLTLFLSPLFALGSKFEGQLQWLSQPSLIISQLKFPTKAILQDTSKPPNRYQAVCILHGFAIVLDHQRSHYTTTVTEIVD
jgi:hypothetical protein